MIAVIWQDATISRRASRATDLWSVRPGRAWGYTACILRTTDLGSV